MMEAKHESYHEPDKYEGKRMNELPPALPEDAPKPVKRQPINLNLVARFAAGGAGVGLVIGSILIVIAAIPMFKHAAEKDRGEGAPWGIFIMIVPMVLGIGGAICGLLGALLGTIVSGFTHKR